MNPPETIERLLGKPMPGTKWVVRGKLGEGGMGIVYDVLKADFLEGAMKVLRPRYAQIPELAARFLDEVRLTATLQHPNLVRVLDYDRLEDGTPFMVMERLRGRTLRAALQQTANRGRSWTPENAYAVAAHVCQGLARAHAHTPSIVHRDVKPENIFLHRFEGSLDPVVKVMDFGIAAVAGDADRRRLGTPRYMAPEQLRGDPVSPQTDQYALALVVYEMLTGRFPWDIDIRDVAAVARAHLRIPPQPPSSFCAWLPAPVEAAIVKALSKDPDERHASVHGLLFELRALHQTGRSYAAGPGTLSTDPMVGTIADGYPPVREDPDAVGLANPAPEPAMPETLALRPGFAAPPEPPPTSDEGVSSRPVGEGSTEIPGARRRGSPTVLFSAALLVALAAGVGTYVRGRGSRTTPVARAASEIPTSAPPAPPATTPGPIADPPLRYPPAEKPGAARRLDGPCPGCRVSLPGGADPRPLLVLLHGDNETASSMFDAWAPAAEARAVAVLALTCPLSEGCTQQSWWQWNGDPAYLREQIRFVTDRQPIDPARMWIAGWSGGASYIGYRTQEIERMFSAIVIHGGGIRPAFASCSNPQASVYFLVGDANPLHNLAVQLRDYYVGCGHDLSWNLLQGATHDGERRALGSRIEGIFDWLATKRRAVSETPVEPRAH